MNLSDRLKKLLNQPQAIQPGRVLGFARARQGITVRTAEGDKQAIAATDISTNDVTLLRDQSGQYWAIAKQAEQRESPRINRFEQTRIKPKRNPIFIPASRADLGLIIVRARPAIGTSVLTTAIEVWTKDSSTDPLIYHGSLTIGGSPSNFGGQFVPDRIRISMAEYIDGIGMVFQAFFQQTAASASEIKYFYDIETLINGAKFQQGAIATIPRQSGFEIPLDTHGLNAHARRFCLEKFVIDQFGDDAKWADNHWYLSEFTATSGLSRSQIKEGYAGYSLGNGIALEKFGYNAPSDNFGGSAYRAQGVFSWANLINGLNFDVQLLAPNGLGTTTLNGTLEPFNIESIGLSLSSLVEGGSQPNKTISQALADGDLDIPQGAGHTNGNLRIANLDSAPLNGSTFAYFPIPRVL